MERDARHAPVQHEVSILKAVWSNSRLASFTSPFNLSSTHNFHSTLREQIESHSYTDKCEGKCYTGGYRQLCLFIENKAFIRHSVFTYHTMKLLRGVP